MSTLKTLFDITEIDDEQFDILIFKDNNQYVISFVIDNKPYQLLLPDAKEITLKRKLRNINAYPLFRMLIQSRFQSLADSNQKNRFKNQDISKLTGKMWGSSEEFREEFEKYTSQVNLHRPKPLYDFKTQDPNQKPTRGKRSSKPNKKSKEENTIIFRDAQPATGSTESFSESLHYGSQWQSNENNNNNTTEQPKQGSNNCNAKLTISENSVPSNDDEFNPLTSMPFEVSQEELEYFYFYYNCYFENVAGVAGQSNSMQYDNNFSSSDVYQNNFQNDFASNSNFNTPSNSNANIFQ
ncbi:4478_t:CDS:1 [Dentiscutata erythropus]|uniref:4478_t:CDS:1 n=1 Tax=Dentiscutata erythropus TaxID=1348616 RepID=A0A9N9N5J2_9GLOM|nr:4478_t:CDS:1 [Dentiscutata erythropus]